MAIETNAMFKLSYGLFVLTAREGTKDNGCIINTAMQVTSSPQRILICVNKGNYTHDMIIRTGMFNVSVLTEKTPFSVFQHYGFQSGRDTDKFADNAGVRSENGICYVPEYSNALISGKVISTTDCGTHTIFVADVTEAKVLSEDPSVTYTYYFANIKPKPQPKEEKKKGYVCKICGYVYEGEELPPDFICPLCKHGAADFEPL
ncbi:MAG: flavin reductase [Lachnospiraceae bacterium]|nr:flavin reductase [Lachnospiraceae bacterium]